MAKKSVKAAVRGDTGDDTITIRGTHIPTRREAIPHHKLSFFKENPRIYSLLREDNDEPTQLEIEEKLLEMEHVRELISDIRRHGGLIESPIVKGGTLEVIEGNSRLAAWRFLSKKAPKKWNKINCLVLPEDTPQALVSALLGQLHLKGKTKWPAYEQAGYLFRRHREDGVKVSDLALEVGITRQKVNTSINAYQFMVDSKDNRRERWSYYLEYVRCLRQPEKGPFRQLEKGPPFGG